MSELTTGMNSEETMEDYKEQLERSFRTLTEGDVVTGTIISITEEEIFIDLQYYTQGILPVSEVTEDPTFVIDEHYAIGDEIKATITSMDDGNGNIKLSVKEAAKVLAWDVLREIQEKNEVITAIDTVVTKGDDFLGNAKDFIVCAEILITAATGLRLSSKLVTLILLFLPSFHILHHIMIYLCLIISTNSSRCIKQCCQEILFDISKL